MPNKQIARLGSLNPGNGERFIAKKAMSYIEIREVFSNNGLFEHCNTLQLVPTNFHELSVALFLKISLRQEIFNSADKDDQTCA